MTAAPSRGVTGPRGRSLGKPAQTPHRAEVRRLLREYHAGHDSGVRDRLVELNADLVRYVARRFANRGEPLEDLEQVGFVGLIQAIQRFDPGLDNEFSTFAMPTIMGEIRRYFRDKSWAVRVPRRLQENYIKVVMARDQLTTELGRVPSIADIATRVGLDPDDVLAALEVAPAQRSVSLEHPITEGDDRSSVGDTIGSVDDNLARVEARELLKRLMAHLTPRERHVLALRFVEELSQAEVAKRLNISQMHVSRLQRAAVEQLRHELEHE